MSQTSDHTDDTDREQTAVVISSMIAAQAILTTAIGLLAWMALNLVGVDAGFLEAVGGTTLAALVGGLLVFSVRRA